jgi:predicted nucleic acid-binding protein
MTLDDVPPGASIFLDSNILVYHFAPHSTVGTACTALVKRIGTAEIQGFTSIHVLAEVTHRLMTIEAMQRLGWPAAGLAARLRKHRSEIPRLTIYRDAIADLPQSGINVLQVTEHLLRQATDASRQYELLTGDALIIAVMRQHGLTNLASHDADFDRVPGVTRYAPA